MIKNYFKHQTEIAQARARFFEQAATLDSGDVISLPTDAHLFTLSAQRKLYEKRQEIAVEPYFSALWRRHYDSDSEELSDFAQRYATQQPLRQAWLEALAEPRQDEPVSTGDRGERILRLLARERVTTRSLLMQKLNLSPATTSRELKALLAAGWVEERGQSEHPGRPQQILRLSATGLERARALGEQADPAPEFESAALAERLFHQAIEQAIRKHLSEAQVARAYSGKPVPSLASPLGTIVPDLVVTSGWNRWVIEAETGKYNYRRLADKLDKYLASSEWEVLVVTEGQDAPTLAHIKQWQHERRNSLPAGVPAGVVLCVRYSTLDKLQQHGLAGNIWQVFEVGDLPQSKQATEPGEMRSTLEILREVMEIEWERFFWGTPARIPNFPELSLPEFIADGVFVQEIFPPECDPEANVIALATRNEWDTGQIATFLDAYSAFVHAYVQQVLEHGHSLRFPDHPWLYGLLVLVDDTPGQESPADLARAFPGWRTALQDWQVGHHPLRVGITHIHQIDKTLMYPSDLINLVYDLSGYC